MRTVNTFSAAEEVIEDAFRADQTLPRNMLVLATTLAQARRPRMRLMVINQLQGMTPTERDLFMADTPVPSDMLAELGSPVEIEPLPVPEASEPTIAQYTAAIERHIEATARQRDYSGSVACTSYAGSTNTVWAAEAAAFLKWRDDVWAYVFTQLAVVEGGGTVPSIDDVLAGLPEMAWPEV